MSSEDNKLDDQTRIERWKWLYEETIRLFRLGSDRGYNDFTLLKKANEILDEIEREAL